MISAVPVHAVSFSDERDTGFGIEEMNATLTELRYIFIHISLISSCGMTSFAAVI